MDLGLKDKDSGLRAFRGIISPWDQIKSFREAYKFAICHAAQMAVGFAHTLRIVEPDYETAQTLISDSWAEGMGDNYCLAVQESRERYGKHANSDENDEFGPAILLASPACSCLAGQDIAVGGGCTCM